MKFKTVQEKRAFRIGCAVGSKKKNSHKTKNKATTRTKSIRKQFDDDFDYSASGRIKGSYTSDGFFEPD